MLYRSSTPIEVGPKLKIFSALWALAAIFHYFSIYGAFAPGLSGDYSYLLSLLVFVSAVFLFLNPGSLFYLNIHCLFQVIEVLVLLPEVPNHWLLAFFVNSTLLSSYAFRAKDREAKLFSALRAQVILLYFFSFFHKLNSDFLNLAHSCASQFYLQAKNWFVFLPGGELSLELVIYLTLVVECLLVFSLLSSRFRKFGMALALVLHFVFTLSIEKNFFNFSSVMYALLFLFLPEQVVEDLSKKLSKGFFKKISRVVVSIVLVLFALNFLVIEQSFFAIYYKLLYAFWFSFALGLLFLFFTYCARMEFAPVKAEFSSLYVYVFLVFLNGSSPYLGIKTRTAWQMYSNLWLSAEESNHLLIPSSLDLFSYLKNKEQPESGLAQKLAIFSKWEREAAKTCVW